MKTNKLFCSLLALVSTVCAVSSLHAEAKPKIKDIVDFRQQSVERDGAEMRPIKKYGYAFGDWDKKVIYLEGRGLLVQAPGGKGGFGGDKSMKFKPGQELALEVVLGNQNRSAGFSLALTDADGTEASWNLALGGKPVGTGLIFRINLAKCDKEDKPGKVPGLDIAKIKKWQVRGNWQSDFNELLVARMFSLEMPAQ